MEIYSLFTIVYMKAPCQGRSHQHHFIKRVDGIHQMLQFAIITANLGGVQVYVSPFIQIRLFKRKHRQALCV